MNMHNLYDIKVIESALEFIMDDGWGKPFNKFSDEDKQEVINSVIKAFDEDNLFILRDKYVVAGRSGTLKANDFVIN